MEKVWSQYQNRIFDFVKASKGNAVVEAVAGSGKTTTIVEALKHAKGQTIFLAFNKAIADELKKRNVNARTLHSICYSPMLRSRGVSGVAGNKMRDLAKHYFTDPKIKKMYAGPCAKLVSLAKNVGIGALVPNHFDAWAALVSHHDIELTHEDASYSVMIKHAMALLDWSNESKDLDFDDLLYCAIRENIALPKFDFVFVDEAQDTNPIRRAILKKVLKHEARLIAVGDPAQAIYGFTGADSNSMDLIAEEFQCERLPLTVTYRCPKNVVEFVNQWVSHIEPSPSAQDGVVENKDKWGLTDFKPQDLVVCRTTKPLIKLGYQFMRSKIPFYIMGREIGQALVAFIRSLDASSVSDLEKKVRKWADREIERALARDNETQAEAARDKADCILHMCEATFNESVDYLCRVLEEMFASKTNAVILATIHKSKGLEANNVWWLNSSQCPSKWAKQEWQQGQEINLCYVAATRAKEALYFIEEEQEP